MELATCLGVLLVSIPEPSPVLLRHLRVFLETTVNAKTSSDAQLIDRCIGSITLVKLRIIFAAIGIYVECVFGVPLSFAL
jgi:hypothetical protein